MTQRGCARAAQHPTLGLTARPGNGEGVCWERDGSGAAKATDGCGRRIAQRQCRGMGVGHLDTLHLPGYAVGPLLVTNSDEVHICP